MNHKPHSPEEIVDLLSEAETALSRGEDIGRLCRRLEISSRSFRHWREWAGLPGEASAGGKTGRKEPGNNGRRHARTR